MGGGGGRVLRSFFPVFSFILCFANCPLFASEHVRNQDININIKLVQIFIFLLFH